MSFMNNIKKMINPGDGYDGDDDYYEGEDDYMDAGPAQNNGYQQNGYQQNSGGYSQPQPQSQPKPQSSSMGFGSDNLELKVIKPEKYDSATARKIADHLLNKRTVVLNLEVTNKEAARRLIDFLSGVAYSLRGYIQKVANNTYVIVPEGVNVSGEQLQEAQKQEEDSDLF